MENKIHIVAFACPVPADYGGIIDVFAKIKTLHFLGVKIYLHYFDAFEKEVSSMIPYCEQIYFYRRKPLWQSVFSLLPVIVHSRRSNKLLKRLGQDAYPILMEGMHCSYYICHPAIRHKIKVIRAHNVEHEYYYGLYKSETNWAKKFFFYLESLKLKRYESKRFGGIFIAPVSIEDEVFFKNIYGANHVRIAPSLHLFEACTPPVLIADFVLYHGNLSVIENSQAAEFLIKKVLPTTNCRLLIAGKNPTPHLINLCTTEGIELIVNPSDELLSQLICTAKANLLYTHQPTGIKLKLLHVLLKNKSIITNDLMLKGTKFENKITAYNTPNEMQNALFLLSQNQLKSCDKAAVDEVLNTHYNNKKNGGIILEMLLTEIQKNY